VGRCRYRYRYQTLGAAKQLPGMPSPPVTGALTHWRKGRYDQSHLSSDRNRRYITRQGRALLAAGSEGTPLVSYGVPYSPILRVVDPDIRVAWPSGCVGEIWARGDNAAIGYWRKPEETEHTFNAELRDPSSGTPERHGCEPGTWGLTTLRTT
jgi:acyl-CoA synthetase (AMP-forming)/AMP-acid ligase II